MAGKTYTFFGGPLDGQVMALPESWYWEFLVPIRFQDTPWATVAVYTGSSESNALTFKHFR